MQPNEEQPEATKKDGHPARRILPEFLLFLFIFATCVLTPLNGQGTLHSLPQIGGRGGNAFAETCPNGMFLTGLGLRTGDDVDAIQMLCLGVNGSRKNDNPWHGGQGGGPHAPLLCPPEAPAVVALEIAAEGQNTVIVNNIHMICATLGPPPIPQTVPAASFDGPPYKVSGGPLAPFTSAPVSGNQGCAPGEVAVGLHGSSGVWLDAVGLVCNKAPVPPTPSTEPPKVIGRINIPKVLTPPGSICDAGFSGPCNALKTLIAANEQRDLAPDVSGLPPTICDAAYAAAARNSPEATDLMSKCRAAGGAATPPTGNLQVDQWAAAGQAIAAGDPLLSEFRRRQPQGAALRGFDAGVGVAGKQSEWGPGKQKILESIAVAYQEGFRTAISFVLDRNRNAELAAIGAAIAAKDPAVNLARTQNADVRYWLGFDIASGLFGDPALGGKGHTSAGPGSDAIRNGLSPLAQKGFSAGVQFQLSRRH